LKNVNFTYFGATSVTGRNRFLLSFAERFGLTHLSQVTMVSMTALSLAALGLSVSQTLLQDNDYAHISSQLTQQLPSADLKLVSQAQLFGTPGNDPAVDSDELPSTQLQWVLQGVFTGTSAENGSAIILAGDQNAQLYKAKQQLPGGAELAEVHADHVVINLGGRLQTLRFPTIGSFSQAPDTTQPITGPVMNIAEDTVSNRREIVRQRLEMLRQRALSR
jgi:general secretion pathway protein C